MQPKRQRLKILDLQRKKENQGEEMKKKPVAFSYRVINKFTNQDFEPAFH